MKATALLVAGTLCGFALGAVSAYTYSGSNIAETLLVLKEIDIHRSEEAALTAYLEQPPSVAAWALQQHLSVLNHHAAEGYPTEKLLAGFFLTHGRLAKVFSLLENQGAANTHAEAALSWGRRAGGELAKIRTTDEIMQMLEKYDRATTNESSSDSQ